MSVTGQTDDSGAPVGPVISLTVDRWEGDRFQLMAELHPQLTEEAVAEIMHNVVPQLLSAARRNEQEAQAQESDHAGA